METILYMETLQRIPLWDKLEVGMVVVVVVLVLVALGMGSRTVIFVEDMEKKKQKNAGRKNNRACR